MKFSALCFTVLFLFSCVPPPSNPVKVDKRFQTTAPSLLYFKNIRSSYYTNTQDASTRIDYYQLRKWGNGNKYPIIYPIIVNDWMNDAAYIQLKPNNFLIFSKDSFQISIDAQKRKYLLNTESLEISTDLAIEIREALQKGKEISINLQNESIPLFENKLDKSNFVTSLNDYLRLVERL